MFFACVLVGALTTSTLLLLECHAWQLDYGVRISEVDMERPVIWIICNESASKLDPDLEDVISKSLAVLVGKKEALPPSSKLRNMTNFLQLGLPVRHAGYVVIVMHKQRTDCSREGVCFVDDVLSSSPTRWFAQVKVHSGADYFQNQASSDDQRPPFQGSQGCQQTLNPRLL